MGMDLSTSVLPWYIPLKVVLWGEGGYYGERMSILHQSLLLFIYGLAVYPQP